MLIRVRPAETLDVADPLRQGVEEVLLRPAEYECEHISSFLSVESYKRSRLSIAYT